MAVGYLNIDDNIEKISRAAGVFAWLGTRARKMQWTMDSTHQVETADKLTLSMNDLNNLNSMKDELAVDEWNEKAILDVYNLGFSAVNNIHLTGYGTLDPDFSMVLSVSTATKVAMDKIGATRGHVHVSQAVRDHHGDGNKVNKQNRQRKRKTQVTEQLFQDQDGDKKRKLASTFIPLGPQTPPP